MFVNGLLWHVLEAPMIPHVQRIDNTSGLSTVYYPVDSVAGFVKLDSYSSGAGIVLELAASGSQSIFVFSIISTLIGSVVLRSISSATGLMGFAN